MRKKALSWLLAVSMILSLFVSMPITAAAGVLPGAVFSDGDLDRVYFSGDTLIFNLSGLPVGTPPTGIPAGTALRVSLGIVDASSTFTDFTLFNTLSNGMGDGTGFYAERVLQADGTLASDISGAIVSTPTPTLGIVAVKLYVFNGSTWQNALQGQSPDYIPLSGADSNAVIWANAKGIVKGYDSDTFGANDFITREQLVTILYRYAQYKGYDVSVGEDTNILSYVDALNISEYAIPAIQWACGAGVMQGDGAKLDPQGSATRAQVAAMLMRFIENVAK